MGISLNSRPKKDATLSSPYHGHPSKARNPQGIDNAMQTCVHQPYWWGAVLVGRSFGAHAPKMRLCKPKRLVQSSLISLVSL